MLTSTKKYTDGIDLVWVCVDKDGYIGAFVTAGIGEIPEIILENNNLLFEKIEDEILSLNKSSNVILTAQLPKSEDFMEIAKRGIFVYDWDNYHQEYSSQPQAYELIATPTTPITVSNISDPNLKFFLESTQQHSLSFKSSLRIDTMYYFNQGT